MQCAACTPCWCDGGVWAAAAQALASNTRVASNKLLMRTHTPLHPRRGLHDDNPAQQQHRGPKDTSAWGEWACTEWPACFECPHKQGLALGLAAGCAFSTVCIHTLLKQQNANACASKPAPLLPLNSAARPCPCPCPAGIEGALVKHLNAPTFTPTGHSACCGEGHGLARCAARPLFQDHPHRAQGKRALSAAFTLHTAAAPVGKGHAP